MSDTIKTPEPPDPGKPRGHASTARVCPACGSTYLGAFHENCPSGAPPVRRTPSAESSIDELPGEAKPFENDPSRQLNQYLLVRQVGRGGMGAVWKAWDRNLTRWVAVKFLLAHEKHDILRFQREAKLAARLRHPNIAAIYEVGQAKSAQLGSDVTHYLAMEFIDGQSLAEVSLPPRSVIDLFVKISGGIDAAHRGGVIHRDLKPQNIMLNAEGWPYVMDFGLAKALQGDSSLSVSGAIMGTPAYMPPEQAEGRLDEIDARSDIYSLGATLYAVLCRRPPFSGQTPLEILNRVSQEEPVTPSSINRDISPALQAVILKAMAKRPKDRYATVGDFARDLQRLQTPEPISAAAPGAYDPTILAPSSRPPSSAKKIGVGILLGLLAGILGLVVVTAVLLSGKEVPRTPLPVASLPVRPEPPPRNPVDPPVPSRQEALPPERTTKPDPVPDPKPDVKIEPRPDPKANLNVAPPADVKPPAAPADVKPPAPPTVDGDERDWTQLKPLLAYETWAQGDAELPKRSNALLGRFLAKDASREAVTARWFSGEIERARELFRKGTRSPEQQLALARHLSSWCDSVTASVGGIAGLQDVVKAVATLRAEADLQTRGSFSLKIIPAPYAQIRRISCDGRALTLARDESPVVLQKLDIGEYRIELTHPDQGTRIVTFGPKDLRDGRTYVVSGKMTDAALKFSELPQ